MNKSTIPSPVYRSYKSTMPDSCDESYLIRCGSNGNNGITYEATWKVVRTTINGKERKEHYTTTCVIFNGKVFLTVEAFMEACRASFVLKTSLETDLKLYGSFDGTTWYVFVSSLTEEGKEHGEWVDSHLFC